MINWCVLSSRCSDTYAATLRSGMINSGAENLSTTVLSDAMEVSPSASWCSPYSPTVYRQHSCSQTEQLYRSFVTKFESISQPRTCFLFRVNSHQDSYINLRNHIVLASSHPRYYCRRHKLRKEKTHQSDASRKHELEKETKLWSGPRSAALESVTR